MTTAQAQDDDAELVAQVARAIFDSHNTTYTMGGTARWESDPDHWRRYARAAIKATRLSVTTPDTTVLVERAWREGWTLCRATLTDDEAFCITEDVQADAWADSETRQALSSTANPTGETSNG